MALTDSITKLIAFVMPPSKDADADAIQHWRILMSGFLVTTVLMFLWLLGAFPYSDGLAFADDVETEIAEALKPITTQVTAITQEQTIQGGYLVSLVKSDLRDQIDRMIRSRCELDGSDPDDNEKKDLINDTIENYQRQYEDIADHFYDEPDCANL